MFAAAAAIVSAMLFLAAAWITIQAFRGIREPHSAPAWFTLVVLVVVVIIKENLFRFVLREAVVVESSAVRSDAWHHRSDAITSAAAFVGISIALIGGSGYESADDWAALFASMIIIYNAHSLFRPALDEVMDAAPSSIIEEQVRSTALSVNGVIALDKCYVRKMGLDYFVDLHVIVKGDLSVREGHLIGHNVKDAICRTNSRIIDALIHIEPESFQ